MNFKAAEIFIIEKLKAELPDHLYYHGVHHTLDVFHSAIEIAEAEGIHGDDLTLLKTAALFHDSGFLYTYQNHEETGCHIAREQLPDFGYLPEQIDVVCGMIMATKIPQQPHSRLEEIICDADLDYLGRDDFFDIGNTLYREFLEMEVVKNEKDWNQLQVKFLQSHDYFTDTAIQLRKPKKMEHLKEVRSIVEKYAA